MNYASISEIYDKPVLEQRQNSYDYIIKNLVKPQKSEPNQRVPAPLGDSRYTTYKRVENFSNNLEEDVLKGIEDKIDTEYNKPEKQYITMEEDEDVECGRFLEHIAKCKKCREFIIKKFNLTPKTSADKNREDMLDIAIYILTGVFVLFLLDSFMSLGKYIKR